MELIKTTFCRGRTRDNRDCLRRTTHLSQMCPDHRSADNKALASFLRESNRIEGIPMGVSIEQQIRVEAFLALDTTTPLIDAVLNLNRMFQPDARLRSRPGDDVRVGKYHPPQGGPEMFTRLDRLLWCFPAMTSYDVHVAFEKLHPFTDGNGRTGRVLWLKWWVQAKGFVPPSFLHQFYYQALENAR